MSAGTEEITFVEYGRRIKEKDQTFSYAPMTGAYLAAIRNYNALAACFPEKFPDYVECSRQDDIHLIPNPFRPENAAKPASRSELPKAFPDPAKPKGRKGVSNEAFKEDDVAEEAEAVPPADAVAVP